MRSRSSTTSTNAEPVAHPHVQQQFVVFAQKITLRLHHLTAGVHHHDLVGLELAAVPEIAGQYHVRADQLAAEHVWVSQPDLEGEYVRALGAERTLQALEHSGAFKQSP